MIIQSLTTDIISVITTTTANLHVLVTYTDRDKTTGVVGQSNRQLTEINTAATTTITAAPAASTSRNIKTINIRNKHANSNNTITVQYNDSANSTLYELHKAILLAGEVLQYAEVSGFSKIFDTTRDSRNFTTLSDQVITDAAMVTVTGLSCPVKGNTAYGFFAFIPHITDATTTGAQFGVKLTSTPTALRAGSIDTVTPSGTSGVFSSGVAQASDTPFTAQTTGTGATAGPALIAGYFVPSADDVFEIRANTEPGSGGTLTTKAGSLLQVFKQTS
jgi:hypothetical protein